MRTYTFAFSTVVHLIVIGVLVVSPIVANGELPAPRRPLSFMLISDVMPVTIPPLVGGGRRSSASSDATEAPVVEPREIAPDAGIEPSQGESVPDGVPGGVPGGIAESILSTIPDAPPPPVEKPAAPVRPGGAIKHPQKIRHVAPIYPAIAQAARVEGTVILDAVIGEDGRVRELKVLRSIPLVDQAAIEAVRQWQFTPTLLNGEPVTVAMTVTVTFTLQK